MQQKNKAMSREHKAVDEAFVFPQGIAGFPDAKRFGFVYTGHGDLICLQGVEAPEAALVLTPWDEGRLGTPPKLSQEQRLCLKLAANEEPMWLLVLNPFADAQWVTANLRAPLAIHVDSRLGLQLLRQEESLDLRYRWMPQPKAVAVG